MKKLTYSLILLLSSAFVVPDAVLAKDDELLMGIFPRRNAKVTVRMFTPLANYLSRKTGKKIRLVTAKNFPVFWKNVMQNKYDIVHYNQLHYIESNAKLGYQVIAMNEEFGKSTIRGGLVVRKDAGVASVKDLKGSTILFGGGKKAFIAYVVNTVTLHRNGLARYSYITKFARNPPNATIATYLKQGDAAGIGDVGLKIPILKKKGVNVAELKMIGLSAPYPQLPWAVNKKMSTDLRKTIQASLLKLNDTVEGKKMLKRAGMTGIKKAADADYNNCRKTINKYKSLTKN